MTIIRSFHTASSTLGYQAENALIVTVSPVRRGVTVFQESLPRFVLVICFLRLVELNYIINKLWHLQRLTGQALQDLILAAIPYAKVLYPFGAMEKRKFPLEEVYILA
jgi:hypothetical protein